MAANQDRFQLLFNNTVDFDVQTAGQVAFHVDASCSHCIQSDLPVENNVRNLRRKDDGEWLPLLSVSTSPVTEGQIGRHNALNMSTSNGFGKSVPDQGANQQLTLFAVWAATAGTALILSTGGGSLQLDADDLDINGSVAGFTGADTGVPVLVYAQWEAGSGDVTFQVGNADPVVVAAHSTTAMNGWDNVQVGDTGGTGLDGLLGEVIVYSNQLSAFEANRVANHLCAKWGVSWKDLA